MKEDKVVAFVGPPGYQPPPLENVIEMLRLDPEGAGNLFARIAKKRFDELAGDHVIRVDEQVLAHPSWVVQQSVCLNLDADEPVELTKLIDRAIQRTAFALRTELVAADEGSKLVTLGALDVKLHALGGAFFNFVLKQKFTVGRDEHPST